eukprot:15421568-Alexandrium_andersonii.AAC.1
MGVALACHVDDGVLACDPGLEKMLTDMLEEFALVKVTGRLPAGSGAGGAMSSGSAPAPSSS